MTYTTILLARDNGLATLTLNAPDKLNAVSRKMIAEIKTCWEELAADSSVRAVLLTGAGRGFCAGADLADPDREASATADSGAALDKYFNPVIRLMRTIPKPIVSAVNGVAAGVGMSFALASDIAIAGKSASFLQAFARIGLLPDGGSTWFLPRLVGDQRARALAMLAPQIPAEKAKEWGLIWDVVDDAALMTTATEIARKLADGPTLALARIKGALAQALQQLGDPGLELALVGRPALGGEQIVQGANARWLGRVSDEELADLYRAATVVAVPSLYEGFGLPILEAMACGAPTVASSRGAMPEVAGEGAIVADPTPSALADAIREALDPTVADRLRAAGPVQAATFTPGAMGRAGWDALRPVLTR